MREMGADRLQRMYFSPVRQVLEKVNQVKEEGHDVISFSIGEPDFDTPERIRKDTIAALENRFTHYAPNRGLPALRKELAVYLQRVCGVSYVPETELLLTCGGAEAINNAFLAFINPGDEVITFSPAFMNYENMIGMAGGTMVSVPLRREDGFQIDAGRLEAAITKKTKLLVLNNPCNPTGAVYTEAVLRQVAALAVKHDLLVFSDEIYNELIYDDTKFVSIASLPGMRERTILMTGFSKAFAMTGWRLGILAADAPLLTKLLLIHQYTTTCLPTFIQQGLVTSMNAEETIREKRAMVREFARRRRIVLEGLDEVRGLSYTTPEGAFYVFVDVSGSGMDGETYADRLLHEKYVAVVPGIKLGRECGDFVRISYATGEERLREGLKRMKEFAEK